jgi:hypothetical protein
MEHGVGDDEVECSIAVWQRSEIGNPKASGRGRGCQAGCQRPHRGDCASIAIHSVDVEARAQKVHDVPPAPTTGVQDSHAGLYATAQKLIE